MKLDEIIGHENIIKQVNKSIAMGMFSHAHLIVGEDGIGKSLIAKGIALKLLGKDIDKEYADIKEFRVPHNKQSIGIKDVVESIIDEINKKPYEGDKKVIIIYEANKMTTEAQNAFLKTIEEPPKGVFIILLSEKLEGILETIKSRCQIHKLQRLNFNEMHSFLNKRYPNLSSKEVKSIIAFSDCIPGRAEKFIEDKAFKEIRDKTLSILMDINNKKPREFLKYEEFFIKYKGDWQEVLTWILSYIRDIMVYKETGSEVLIMNLDKIDNIKDAASMFSFNRLNDIIEVVNETRQRLERNVNTSLTFSSMLFKFLDT
ncbi:DNA polymerase III subunit delta' [Clostridium sp. SYSU_GA19001]|uniref:DNA polymerase III subunit delta' n=1 Tax=Clostridium caldaquaticum TaxID=2940653 RepID=UPI002076E6E7|nr:DNA polymerase III subunit delta' [Clostridium caldaquaticum]MCM8709654.1 DNA polymerase III subunit delta' [Clostridium caldaquaticum]